MTLKEILIAGKLTISEGGGGGGSVQTASGTFHGDDSLQVKINCAFKPDALFVKRIDPATLTERVFGGFIGMTVDNYVGCATYQVYANSTAISTLGGGFISEGYSYTDGLIKIDLPSGRPVSSQAEYFWYAIKWTE